MASAPDETHAKLIPDRYEKEGHCRSCGEWLKDYESGFCFDCVGAMDGEVPGEMV